MSIDAREILRVLYWRRGGTRRGGAGRCSIDHLAYQLATLVLDQHRFSNLTGLLDFLREPDNLKTWLPSASDREACSANLLETLAPLRAA